MFFFTIQIYCVSASQTNGIKRCHTKSTHYKHWIKKKHQNITTIDEYLQLD